MKRRLRNFLTALSLLICVAACVSWAWSYHSQHLAMLWLRNGFNVQLMAGRGQLAGLMKTHPQGAPEIASFEFFTFRPDRLVSSKALWKSLGFYRRRDTESTIVIIPHWYFALATAVLPAWVIALRVRLRSRRRRGLCRRCEYDLRATPERCPECGECATGLGGPDSGEMA